MKKNLVWIGPRESDIDYTGKLFDYSITVYGSNSNNNVSGCCGVGRRCNHNGFDKDLNDYLRSIETELCKEKDTVFMVYNPSILKDFSEDVLSHVICKNDQSLIDLLNNKIHFRRWAQSMVAIPKYTTVSGNDISFDTLAKKLETDRMIIQSPLSSGGLYTFYMDKKSFGEKHAEFLCKDEKYLVSEYIEHSVPVNMHAIICENTILLFQGSVQIIIPNKDRMIYRGSDYCAFNTITLKTRKKFASEVKLLCEELKQLGYRGIIGFDAIITEDNLFFIEANPRFQASSRLLNKALNNNGLPSLQAINLLAFSREPLSFDTESISVDYSFISYHYSDEAMIHGKHILEQIAVGDSNKYCNTDVLLNGFNPQDAFDKDAYMFEIACERNLVEIKPFHEICIHPNISEPSNVWMNHILKKDDISLKIALINRGVRLTPLAISQTKADGLREGVNSSLDIIIPRCIVNCPINIPITTFTPFSIDYSDNNKGLVLYCYDTELFPVRLYSSDKLVHHKTLNGVNVTDICLASTDRLRIRHCHNCTFGKPDTVCRFCGDSVFFDPSIPEYNHEDISEAVEIFFSACRFRHILIGGPSDPATIEADKILQILKLLRSYRKMPIYLMSLPPADASVLDHYFQNGITEVAFNIEIFDRDLAVYYMPAKGRIPFERYEKALEYAVSLWGNNGNVRTSFVAGLEPVESLLKGINWCCKLGVSPIISPFRPVPGTQEESSMPFSDEKLLEIYKAASAICNQYGLSLGPECEACKNNTLAI